MGLTQMIIIIDEAGRIALPSHIIEEYRLRDCQIVRIRFSPDLSGLHMMPTSDFLDESDTSAPVPLHTELPKDQWEFRRTFAEGDKNIVLPAAMMQELGWTWGTALLPESRDGIILLRLA